MSTVVVLNRNYEYCAEVSIKKVLKWLSKEKIEIIVTHETEEVGSISFRIKMPLVVRLLKYVGFKPRTEKIQYSQEAVYHRDNYICGYWHYENGKKVKHKCEESELSIDHIMPVSRGGARASFENTVCACKNCNINIKKNRTPQEAGLELIRKPFIPVRDKNSFVIAKFAFNPSKISHRKYFEDILGCSL